MPRLPTRRQIPTVLLIQAQIITEATAMVAHRPFHHRPRPRRLTAISSLTMCIIRVIRAMQISHRFFIIIPIIRWRWRPPLPYNIRYCRLQRRLIDRIQIQRPIQSTK